MLDISYKIIYRVNITCTCIYNLPFTVGEFGSTCTNSEGCSDLTDGGCLDDGKICVVCKNGYRVIDIFCKQGTFCNYIDYIPYFITMLLIFSSTVSKKKSTYCDRYIVVVVQKLEYSPFLKKIFKVSTPNLEN